ncbi:MAG: hypothetical protein ACRDRS_21130 [Pseudonocardiaceae bacterium]
MSDTRPAAGRGLSATPTVRPCPAAVPAFPRSRVSEGKGHHVTDQPRTRYPIQVSIQGTRADTDDNTAATLLAVQETDGR